MFNEASLHLAKCSHGARILAQISLCNLATFRQNKQNAARLARRQALVINTRVVARQKPSRFPIFFPRDGVFSEENQPREAAACIAVEKGEARMLSVHLSLLNLAT